jgi:hypothetical protein
MATAGAGCSDDGAPTASGLAMSAAEEATEQATATTTAPAATAATPSTVDPVVGARADFVASVEVICSSVFADVRGGPPDDLDAVLAWTRALETAYHDFADRVEALTPPDRQTEANLVEGVRRLRRAADLLVPAIEAATGLDVAGYDRAWWSFGMALQGAGTALYAAGVPSSCWS